MTPPSIASPPFPSYLAIEPPLAPPGATRHSVRLSGHEISYLEWPAGETAGPGSPAPAGVRTALLLHGLQSTALTMTRIAEGLAARGWRVIAPDLPGHGHSYALDGSDSDRPGPFDISRRAILRHRLSRRHRLRTTAAIVVDFARRIGLDRPVLIGHSWGASLAPVLAADLAPARLILLDPPFVTAKQARALGPSLLAPPTDSYATARETLLSDRADWHPMDLAAKAEALTRVSTHAMVGVVAANVPFDPTPALARLLPHQPGLPVFVITGEPGRGSFVSPAGLDGLRRLLGEDRVLVMSGAGHSPHRTHYDEFMGLLWRALGAAS